MVEQQSFINAVEQQSFLAGHHHQQCSRHSSLLDHQLPVIQEQHQSDQQLLAEEEVIVIDREEQHDYTFLSVAVQGGTRHHEEQVHSFEQNFLQEEMQQQQLWLANNATMMEQQALADQWHPADAPTSSSHLLEADDASFFQINDAIMGDEGAHLKRSSERPADNETPTKRQQIVRLVPENEVQYHGERVLFQDDVEVWQERDHFEEEAIDFAPAEDENDDCIVENDDDEFGDY